ncbi:uncharacterized protein CTHT_0048870 [Thermochaetoides thermophila DSM 1495]|uniref:Ribosome assembly protein 3 n=1 Tax=Chaetomium thermophilum (strain DSM 1495 / CBS 144.50 / IMI 039719) TaxID=759272 RepID=G0SB47_CHATD|nr:hypothetical protein CTHT_0048870 [Thermochaetoides thermophila DSM 1495]EGS19427.1 hypothetical protein CTHT_0048870 [Thermochaetoides thermophila DSM 1495]
MAPPSQKSATKTDEQVAAQFTSYYLQRATKEFAEDLDRVRNADDFKNEALPILINALQQGTRMFSPEEQRRIVTATAAASSASSKQGEDE